ncbi:hypothetical protein BHM03_00031772 [Ensete ventricosum]|nr:hypothetical protein BHM03_00031772 [Ensete ventricosum]
MARPRPRPAQRQQPVGATPAGMAGYDQPAKATADRSAAPAKGQAAGRRAQVAAARSQAARGGCLRHDCKGGGRQRLARKGLPLAANPTACAGAAAAVA